MIQNNTVRIWEKYYKIPNQPNSERLVNVHHDEKPKPKRNSNDSYAQMPCRSELVSPETNPLLHPHTIATNSASA
jgi:hypothetical protein